MKSKERMILLHRNMLLPFSGLPYIDESEEEDQMESIVVTPVDDNHTTGRSDSSTEDESEAEQIRQKDLLFRNVLFRKEEINVRRIIVAEVVLIGTGSKHFEKSPPRRGNRR